MTAPVSLRSSSVRPSVAQAASLPPGRDAQMALEQLWPYIQKYAQQYGADPKVLAGIIAQGTRPCRARGSGRARRPLGLALDTRDKGVD